MIAASPRNPTSLPMLMTTVWASPAALRMTFVFHMVEFAGCTTNHQPHPARVAATSAANLAGARASFMLVPTSSPLASSLALICPRPAPDIGLIADRAGRVASISPTKPRRSLPSARLRTPLAIRSQVLSACHHNDSPPFHSGFIRNSHGSIYLDYVHTHLDCKWTISWSPSNLGQLSAGCSAIFPQPLSGLLHQPGSSQEHASVEPTLVLGSQVLRFQQGAHLITRLAAVLHSDALGLAQIL